MRALIDEWYQVFISLFIFYKLNNDIKNINGQIGKVG